MFSLAYIAAANSPLLCVFWGFFFLLFFSFHFCLVPFKCTWPFHLYVSMANEMCVQHIQANTTHIQVRHRRKQTNSNSYTVKELFFPFTHCGCCCCCCYIFCLFVWSHSMFFFPFVGYHLSRTTSALPRKSTSPFFFRLFALFLLFKCVQLLTLCPCACVRVIWPGGRGEGMTTSTSLIPNGT